MTRWIALMLMLLPAAAAAQTSGAGPFVSTNASLPGSPTLAGVTAASYSGAFGLRGSTGVRTEGEGVPLPGLRDAWVADLDVSLAPMRLWRGHNGGTGLEPALFFGIGFQGGKDDGDRYAVPNTSYGAALWYPLTRWLRVESEARRRSPFGGSDDVPAEVARGWELRFGVAVLWSRTPSTRVAATRPPPAPPPARPLPRDVATEGDIGRLADSLLGTAADYLGTPYRFGGTDPTTGLDCSAFIQRVYRAHGLTLPRTSRQQVQLGLSVDPDQGLQPGDLLFFASNGSRIDHVALYTGENTIVHATSSGGGVRYDDLASSRGRWFTDHMVAVRRILGTELSAAALSHMAADNEGLDPPDLAPPATRDR